MEEEKEERWAILVDGIAIPGYTEDKAKKEIDNNPELRGKRAVATRLYGSPPKELGKSTTTI
ncbi:MAG: hypothetical protein ABIB72_01925 [Candidatus Falkowbacteria bacterium]